MAKHTLDPPADSHPPTQLPRHPATQPITQPAIQSACQPCTSLNSRSTNENIEIYDTIKQQLQQHPRHKTKTEAVAAVATERIPPPDLARVEKNYPHPPTPTLHHSPTYPTTHLPTHPPQPTHPPAYAFVDLRSNAQQSTTSTKK